MTRLIIDTDVALGVWHDGRPRDIDDGFAIVEAINATAIDLVGITCVYGNGPIDEVYRVAQEIVSLKASDVPVVRGAAEKMSKTPDTNPAVEFLAAALEEAPATIAAIGPLTNIGILLRDHPHLAPKIQEVIIVAGRTPGNEFFIGDAGPVNDFNFENDTHAAEILMQSGVPVVCMGFELTSQVCVTAQDLETIHNHPGDTANYFYENSLAWCTYWTDTFPNDAGFHPWDSAAIAWLLNKNWFQFEARGCEIVHDPKRFNCGVDISGTQHTYVHGFSAGGDQAFVEGVIREVY